MIQVHPFLLLPLRRVLTLLGRGATGTPRRGTSMSPEPSRCLLGRHYLACTCRSPPLVSRLSPPTSRVQNEDEGASQVRVEGSAVCEPSPLSYPGDWRPGGGLIPPGHIRAIGQPEGGFSG